MIFRQVLEMSTMIFNRKVDFYDVANVFMISGIILVILTITFVISRMIL